MPRPADEPLRRVTLNDILLANSRREGECLIWIGNLNNYGYGQFRFEKQMWLAHRASWTVHKGPIPQGIQILHRCDTPACFEINHLFDGSQQDNINDCMAKGRRYKHDRKITIQQLEEMHYLHDTGYTYKKLAEHFGVTRQTIYRYINGHMSCQE